MGTHFFIVNSYFKNITSDWTFLSIHTKKLKAWQHFSGKFQRNLTGYHSQLYDRRLTGYLLRIPTAPRTEFPLRFNKIAGKPGIRPKGGESWLHSKWLMPDLYHILFFQDIGKTLIFCFEKPYFCGKRLTDIQSTYEREPCLQNNLWRFERYMTFISV
jgi:hypothetical protein